MISAHVMDGADVVQIVVVPVLNLSLLTALTVHAESHVRVGVQLARPRPAAQVADPP